MADSPEHRTLTQHRSDLVIALADEVYRLSDELFAKGLISGDNANTVKTLCKVLLLKRFSLQNISWIELNEIQENIKPLLMC